MPKIAKKPTRKAASSKKAAGTRTVSPPAKKAERKTARKLVQATPFVLANADATVLDRLFETVTSRKGTDPTISHSARLLSRGTSKIAQKFGEEAVECLIEAVSGHADELISESADVLYHLIVMWVDAGITPGDVWAEMQRREGTSGIAEKASRPRNPLA